jgi:hypothetical protein
MAPRDGVRCWVCGRTVEEVRQSVGTTAPEMTDVDRSMAKVVDARAKFVREATEWWDTVPDQFKNMDFNFVMGNPSQFKTIRFIDEVQEARKIHVEALGEAAYLGRKGKEFSIGDLKVDAGDAKRRDVVTRELDEFERKTGRVLERGRSGNGDKSDSDATRPRSFDGFKLGEGLRYLREAGTLYYYVQQKMLELDKEEEKKKAPTYEIGMARIKGIPKAVPLCTVCENLIKGL